MILAGAELGCLREVLVIAAAVVAGMAWLRRLFTKKQA